MINKVRFILPLAVPAMLMLASASLTAQAELSEVRRFNIPPQPLDSALLEYSEQAGLQLVVAASSVKGLETDGFSGEGTAEEALLALLGDTELKFGAVGDTVTITDNGAGKSSEDSQPAPDKPPVAAPERSESRTEPGAAESDPQARPDAENAADPLELAPQVVTGSRLDKTSYEISTQVITISQEDLINMGEPTLERALRRLPQNIDGTTEFLGAGVAGGTDTSAVGRYRLGTQNINGASTVNLRGLGEVATLILIDGKRVGHSGILGGYTDISEIPISVIDRVEIQFDGASAIYGSDAIGGVVNIILKKDYDLRRVSLRRTARTRGGLVEDDASFSAGTAWQTGSVMVTLDHYRATEQSAGEANLNLSDVYAAGYPGNVRGRRGTQSDPAEISPVLTQAALDAGVIAEGETVNVAPIPTGQDGTALSLDDFLNTANTFRTDEDLEPPPVSVAPPTQRSGVRLFARQELGNWLNVSGGLSYRKREVTTNSGRAGNPFGGAGGTYMSFRVAEENPYNPFGADVNVDLVLPDFGPEIVEAERESFTADLDFDGALGNGWIWELRSRYEDRASIAKSINAIDYRALQELTSDSRVDPSEALNIFGNSFLTDSNNAAVLAATDFYHPLQRTDTTNKHLSSELILRGESLSLPGGRLGLAAGMEWRRASLDVDYGLTFFRLVNIGSPVPTASLLDGFAMEGTLTTRSGFVEAFIPIVGQPNRSRGFHDLSVTLGGRHEQTSGSGPSTSTRHQSNVWSAGLAWRPLEPVTLRFNRSTSFRAPDIANSLLTPLVGTTVMLDFRGGGFAINFLDTISGGNPDLLPERSVNNNAGIEFRPLPGLRLGVHWHETSYFDRITRPTAAFLVLTDELYAKYAFLYTLDEDGEIVLRDDRQINIARYATAGLDYRLNYEFGWGDNTFGLQASVAETRKLFEDINPLDDEDDEEEIGVRIPKYRYMASAYFQRGGLHLALNATSASGLRYETTQRIHPDDEDRTRVKVKTRPARIVNFRATFDIDESWTNAPGYLQGVRLAGGLNNIFRSFTKSRFDPEPYREHGVTRGLDSLRGQMYYLEISKEF